MGARTETQTEFGTEMEVGAEAETRAESEFESETETRAESEFEAETETELRAESESKSETESEMETELRAESESESKSETETEMETELRAEFGTESEHSEYEFEDETDSAMQEIKYYSSRKPICKLSDPAQPHTLVRVYGRPSSPECFSCKGPIFRADYNYRCLSCCLYFHNGCHHYPPEIRHPFHLQHPLTITFANPQTQADFLPPAGYQTSYTKESKYDDSSDDDVSDSESNLSVMKCKCCRKNLGDTYYACSICAFTLHLSCSKFSPPLTINHPKAHEHTLTLLPRKTPSPCDACGVSLCRQSDPFYACLLCNYMVHRKCIKLPRVIKITRHQHRVAYTSSLPPLDFSCGVCRKSVDINCGQYSCTMGCLYSVHSKCATKKAVWDGKELEDVPLEEEEDILPFTRIDDETIHHFNHEHHLRFNGNDDDYDIRKEIIFCQACVLPIISDPFYRCMQCNFVLHEACASRSLKIHHPLHIHPLSFVLMPPLPEIFECNACRQQCLGFLYKCREKDCYYEIDARCASIPEPFNHKSHPHPLYFTLGQGNCMRCEEDKYSSISMVECLECSSFFCLECGTLPYVVIYKHDRHPLTLCYGEENASGTYWCEICEGELDAKVWFYRCQECCLTIHIRCILGVDPNLKPGHSFKHRRSEVNIVPNSGNSRPLCKRCGLRCKDPQFFKFAEDSEAYCCYDGCMDYYEK